MSEVKLDSPEQIASDIVQKLETMSRSIHDGDDPSVQPTIDALRAAVLSGVRDFGSREMTDALSVALKRLLKKAISWRELRSWFSTTGWHAWYAYYLCELGYPLFYDNDGLAPSYPIFRTSKRLDFTNGRATFFLALHKLADGDTKTALKWLNRPHHKEWRHECAGVLACMLEALDADELPNVDTKLRKLAADVPMPLLVWAAGALSDIGHDDLAKKLVDVAIAPRIDDCDANIRGCYAFVLRKVGRKEDALRRYESLLNEDEELAAETQRTIGFMHYESERWQEAIDAFEASLALDPNTPDSLIFAAAARLRMQDVPGAIDTLRRKPNSVPPDGNQRVIEAAVGLMTHDANWATPLDHLDPDQDTFGQAWDAIMWAAEHTGHLTELEAWCGAGNNKHRRDLLAYVVVSHYFCHERWAEAARGFAAAKEAGDDDPNIDLHMAMARLRYEDAPAVLESIMAASRAPKLESDWLLVEAAARALAHDQNWMDPLHRLSRSREAYDESFETLIWAAQHSSRLEDLKAWCEEGHDVHRRDTAHFITETDDAGASTLTP